MVTIVVAAMALAVGTTLTACHGRGDVKPNLSIPKKPFAMTEGDHRTGFSYKLKEEIGSILQSIIMATLLAVGRGQESLNIRLFFPDRPWVVENELKSLPALKHTQYAFKHWFLAQLHAWVLNGPRPLTTGPAVSAFCSLILSRNQFKDSFSARWRLSWWPIDIFLTQCVSRSKPKKSCSAALNQIGVSYTDYCSDQINSAQSSFIWSGSGFTTLSVDWSHTGADQPVSFEHRAQKYGQGIYEQYHHGIVPPESRLCAPGKVPHGYAPCRTAMYFTL